MPTALVTGATSGIGEAFARQLAARGYRLVIVARDAERLAERRSSLLAARCPGGRDDRRGPDGRAGQGTWSPIGCDPRDDPIDLLVNNAGGTLPMEFLQATEADLIRQVELNAVAVMLLTHAALPGMLGQGPRRGDQRRVDGGAGAGSRVDLRRVQVVRGVVQRGTVGDAARDRGAGAGAVPGVRPHRVPSTGEDRHVARTRPGPTSTSTSWWPRRWPICGRTGRCPSRRCSTRRCTWSPSSRRGRWCAAGPRRRS